MRQCLVTVIGVILASSIMSMMAFSRDMVSTGQEFSLHIDQSVKVQEAGFTVMFKAVLEDSRCPLGVDCVWAGNCKVALDILNGQDGNRRITLNTGIHPMFEMLGSHEIHLLALEPQAIDGVSISLEEYVVHLKVVKKSTNP